MVSFWNTSNQILFLFKFLFDLLLILLNSIRHKSFLNSICQYSSFWIFKLIFTNPLYILNILWLDLFLRINIKFIIFFSIILSLFLVFYNLLFTTLVFRIKWLFVHGSHAIFMKSIIYLRMRALFFLFFWVFMNTLKLFLNSLSVQTQRFIS